MEKREGGPEAGTDELNHTYFKILYFSILPSIASTVNFEDVLCRTRSFK